MKWNKKRNRRMIRQNPRCITRIEGTDIIETTFKGCKMRKIRSFGVFYLFETNHLLAQEENNEKNQTQKVIKMDKIPKKIKRVNWRNCW